MLENRIYTLHIIGTFNSYANSGIQPEVNYFSKIENNVSLK